MYLEKYYVNLISTEKTNVFDVKLIVYNNTHEKFKWRIFSQSGKNLWTQIQYYIKREKFKYVKWKYRDFFDIWNLRLQR